MQRSPLRHCCFLLTLAVTVVLGGCATFNIAKPTANQTVTSPVAAEVDWGYSYHAFKVVLDPTGQNLDVTSQFTVTSVSGGYAATASLPMSPGQHTLSVSGSIFTWYTQDYENTSAQQTFTVMGVPGSLGISATPNPLPVTGTSAATLTVAVTIGGSATGPATVNVTGLPGTGGSQVIANPSTLSFTGNGSAPTNITAPASLAANSYSFTLDGSATGANSSASVALKVLPTITSASPPAQRRGGTMVLAGTHFDTNCSNNKVMIGGAPASLTPPCSATSLKAVIPAAASPGLTSIVATVNGQNSAALAATVTPTEIVVVGAPTSITFAVIDFTDPANPSVVPVSPGLGGGTLVSCNGNEVAVGDASLPGTGKIVMYDVSDPSHPMEQGSFVSNFEAIGGIKFDGSRVLAGDANGFQVVLLDATDPTSLSQIGSKILTGLSKISSTGLKGTIGIASALLSSTIEIINGIPNNLTHASFNPNNGIGLTASLSGTLSAVGSKNGGTVKLVDVSGPTVLGSQSTTLGSIDSAAISGSTVAVGSKNNSSMFLINFADPAAPQVSNPIVVPGSTGGWTVTFNGSPLQTPLHMFAGNQHASDINLFSVTIDSTTKKPVATLLKSVNSGIFGIASACATSF